MFSSIIRLPEALQILLTGVFALAVLSTFTHVTVFCLHKVYLWSIGVDVNAWVEAYRAMSLCVNIVEIYILETLKALKWVGSLYYDLYAGAFSRLESDVQQVADLHMWINGWLQWFKEALAWLNFQTGGVFLLLAVKAELYYESAGGVEALQKLAMSFLRTLWGAIEELQYLPEDIGKLYEALTRLEIPEGMKGLVSEKRK